jgi:CBS domain-containing protein
MEQYRVRDLMVPFSEYASVRVGTTLLEALRTLERAQEAYSMSKYEHRAVLVLDDGGKVVGKISQLRALRAIETEFTGQVEMDSLRSFGFSNTYLAGLKEKHRLQGQVITTETLKKAAAMKVESFMQTPTPGEFVAEDATLDTAIHLLTAGAHLSLLVTRDDKIVGILRISDVFAAVFHEMMATAT